ncbi:MAG: TolB-like translocation protein [Propionibacteriales bacterium]|nr:TolB-like translocation protein [Propionibacteriales bacterium]
MSRKVRLLILIVVCAVAITVSTVYVLESRSRHAGAARSVPLLSQTSRATIEDGARIVFEHTGLGSDFGRVAMVSLDHPGGQRAMTDTSCERVTATDSLQLCLSADRGMLTTYAATVTGPDGRADLPLPGIPNRARLSPDGRYAATTSFVSGDSYAAASFSTRTMITDLETGASTDLEEYELVHQDQPIRPVDRNFWGVTFVPQNTSRFFATVAWRGETWLVEGDIEDRQMKTVRADAECPSISPDGRSLVYKKRAERTPGDWRLVRLDLQYGVETLLAETRSVDDQVEWLDEEHVIYGIPREGDQAAITDVYVLPVDGVGEPVLLIEQAWSPTVVTSGT